jgi:glycosyltransferase involved in cell wall biosynthesis
MAPKKLLGLPVKLSVIIPAYNRAHLIGETLRSLLMQTRPADEIIVVDDGSTDDTAAVAAGFGAPVKVIRQANGGPAAARNTGFRDSRGEFIHFFDSDDLAAPNKHVVQLAALETTGADIAIGPWVQGRFRGKRFAASNHVLQQHGLPVGKNLVNKLLSNWSFVPHSALFRRSIVEKAGGFPEELFVAEDQFVFLACLLAGARVVHTPGTIEFYRLGDGGKITESKEWAARRLREWARFLIKAREACLKKGIEPLRWFGYRRRLWEVKQDLENAQCADDDLMNQLHAWAPAGIAAVTCHWNRQIERWRGGWQQRMTGGRAFSAFRMGPITPEQILLLDELGYSYEPPCRLPWFLGKKGED